jgi:hypothetical protein
VNISIRPLLMSGVALALAGTVALSPAIIAPPAMAPPSVPSVHIDDVQLAGIGQDIYNAITPTVQYVVGGGSYIVNFTPIIGGPIAAQININYFQGIQPVIEATVDALAGVVQDPFNFLTPLSIYGSALYDIGYNWVSAQLRFLGLAPLPLLPSVASVRGASAPSAAARTPGRPRAAAVETPPPPGEVPAPEPVVPVIMCCSPQVEPPVAAEGPGPAGTARRAPRAAAARSIPRALPRAAQAVEVRGTVGPTRASVAEASPRR